MLPIIPFNILIPLTIAASLLCLSLILGIIARRALIRWYSRGGGRLTDQAELLIRHTRRVEDRSANALLRWLGKSRPARIESFVIAIERIEQSNGSLRGWLVNETTVPEHLAQIVATPAKTKIKLLPTSRWTRVAAAHALARLRLHGTLPSLEQAMDDDDHDVGYAAADAIAKLNTPQAADALMNRISAQPKLNNARLAALIDHMSCDMTDLFKHHLERTDSQALFWTTTLIGQKEVFELVTVVKPLLESEDPNVRAAACECIGDLKIPLTDRWLAPLLWDEKWFVQSHAAKSLGELGAAWATEDLVELVNSDEWWVRQNAADALVKIGGHAGDAVEKLLWSEDRFARNTAVEILNRLDWIDSVLQRALERDKEAEPLLRQFVVNGGLGYLENAVFTAPEPTLPLLLTILRELGDDATYGRLRAAAEQREEHLREDVYQVAAEVRGR